MKTNKILLAAAAAALFIGAPAAFAAEEMKGDVCIGGNACGGKSACKTSRSEGPGKALGGKVDNACKGHGLVKGVSADECKKLQQENDPKGETKAAK